MCGDSFEMIGEDLFLGLKELFLGWRPPLACTLQVFKEFQT